MMLLRGSFERRTDSQSRVRLPRPFRKAIGTAPLAVVARRDCLGVVAESKLGTFRRWCSESDAKDCKKTKTGRQAGKAERSTEPLPVLGLARVDREGRIRLPKPSTALVREHGDEVLLIGHAIGFEIWDRVRFQNYICRTPSWSDQDAELLRDMDL